MQRLDRQRHVGGAGVLEQFPDAIAHLAARQCDVLVRRLARQSARQPAHHQHQARGVEFAGLVNGAAVVVPRGTQALRIGRREHAASAVAGEFQAMCLDQPGNCFKTCGGDLIAPGRDGANAPARAGFDDFRQRQLDAARLANGRGVDRKPAVVAGEVAHGGVMPDSIRHPWPRWIAGRARNDSRVSLFDSVHRQQLFMRRTASSGCSSRLAASARRNSSARCGSERVLCWPPTMVKWLWWPLSHAMNTTPVL